jgi:N-acetylgalactosamine kinase
MDRGIDSPRGFNAVVGGAIPIASGLASSSALVVAFAVALLSVNNLELDRHALADALARGEQYVGTRGGGMDQAVCLLAQEKHAIKIDFFPLRIEHIPLPREYSFVVCDSMVSAPKSAGARFAYNLRAAESRIAAAVLSRSLAVPIKRLGDLYSPDLALSEAKIDSLMKETFRKHAYSPAEIAHLLDMSMNDFRHSCLGAFSDMEAQLLGNLKLRSRCRHTLTEGRRVRQASLALRNGAMDGFGRLMYESHRSCANDYEVSIPELDALVAIARDAGALGSRLTGAGFGGCTISLVRDTEVDGFIEAVEERYYRDFLRNGMPDISGIPEQWDRVFVCKSAKGAGELSA